MTNERKAANVIKSIPIKWEQDTNNIITRYATNFAIQHSEDEFFLSFYEIRPPFLTGTQEQLNEQLNNLEYLKAECVARIAISFKKMPEVIEAIQGNYQTYLASHRKEDEEKTR